MFLVWAETDVTRQQVFPYNPAFMATPGEIVKAGFDAALRPFSDLIMKIAGPAADEIGLTLQDHVKVFRLKRQLRLLERVKDMVGEEEPQRVPLRIVEEVVQAASVEESDDLQDCWAALLANAALDANKVHPAFIEVLKQLNAQEAQMLDLISNNRRLASETTLLSELPLSDEIILTEEQRQRALKRFDDHTSNLLRLGLIEIKTVERDDTYISFTTFGRSFRDACRPPEKERG